MNAVGIERASATTLPITGRRALRAFLLVTLAVKGGGGLALDALPGRWLRTPSAIGDRPAAGRAAGPAV